MVLFAFERLYDSLLKDVVALAILCLFVEPNSLDYLKIKTSVSDDYRMTIAVIEQWGDNNFEREDLNGFRLKFDHLEYLENDEASYQKLVDALNNDDGLFVVGYDDIIYSYWEKLGISDYLFNDQYYKLDKENGDVKVSWDAFSFVHYVIIYYLMGV